MSFCDEIHKFLLGKGIEASEEDMCGVSVLQCSGGVIIVPVEIRSETLAEAEDAGTNLRLVLSDLHDKKTIIVPEDIWRRAREMTENRLLAHLGKFRSVFARNTQVRRITKPQASQFLGRCHTYGDASARYRYGLFTKDSELVAVGSFSSGRTWKKEDATIRSYEWVRYASLPDTRVVGGMGKVLSAFIVEVHPDDVMSYADLEWTDGQVYERLGFIPDGVREPVAFSVNPDTWKRTALTRVNCESGLSEAYFHVNLGSRKYRLRR